MREISGTEKSPFVCARRKTVLPIRKDSEIGDIANLLDRLIYHASKERKVILIRNDKEERTVCDKVNFVFRW